MASPNKTRVQVATDPAFSNIVHDVEGAYTTAIQVAEDVLPKGINLYTRGMHGHPESGDSSWSTTVQFMVAVMYGNELFYTAGDYTFTVPAGVNEICVAVVPGNNYSSAGELLKAYIGKTVACVAGNNTIPPGIDSITLSGKGAAGTSSVSWVYNSKTTSVFTNYPLELSNPYPSVITLKVGTTSGLQAGYRSDKSTATKIAYGYDFDYIYYTKQTSTTTGASTTAVVNGTTYTFPGGNGGAASITNHTIPVDPAVGTTVNATLASGGSLSYSYSAYAINALGSLLGNNFTLSPIAADIGTYVGGIAAWRNSIPVSPGDTIPVHVGTGGAVNIIWGTGRSFPNSEV